MIGVAEFIAKNYYNDDTVTGVQRVQTLLSHPGIYFEGLPDQGLVLVYMLVSDEGLQMLRDLKTPEDFKGGFSDRLMQHPGDNVYVFRIVSEGRPAIDQLRTIRTRIIEKHNAKTFSWHDNQRVILHTYEVK